MSILAQKVVGALQYLGYSKLLRLASPNEAALGQLMTFFTGDEERIIEGVIVATLFLGEKVFIIVISALFFGIFYLSYFSGEYWTNY